MVIDALARSEGIDMRKLEHSAAVGRGQLHGQKVILAKPMTFMNNSGDSVAALARFYKVAAACTCNACGSSRLYVVSVVGCASQRSCKEAARWYACRSHSSLGCQSMHSLC